MVSQLCLDKVALTVESHDQHLPVANIRSSVAGKRELRLPGPVNCSQGFHFHIKRNSPLEKCLKLSLTPEGCTVEACHNFPDDACLVPSSFDGPE